MVSVESERGRRKRIVGTVVGNKMCKTIVVEVARLLKHQKIWEIHKKIYDL